MIHRLENRTADMAVTPLDPSELNKRPLSGLGKVGLALVVALALVFATAILRPDTANAETVRTGARWDHVDVLLDSNETSSVARGIAGGGSVCWKVGAAAAAAGMTRGPLGGFVAAIVGGGVCGSAVTTCAAQAYLHGKRAGMTFSPAWYGVRYWCWTY